MYYPYFRGKQFELILLRDNAIFLADNSIHPIIEPVKENFTALTKTMKALHESNAESTVIINPQVGEPPVSETLITKELIKKSLKDFNSFSIGYILHAESDIEELTALLNQFKKVHFTLIHYGFKEGKKLSLNFHQTNRANIFS